MPRKQAPRGNAGKLPRKTATRVETEKRLRVVERCISIGIYEMESVQTELEAQGFKVSNRVVYGYIRKVRERLKEEDRELRLLRKAVLIRDAQRYERVIFGKLMDSNAKPKWKDLVAILKIRGSLEAGQFEEIPAAPIVVEEDKDLHGLDAEELDGMIVSMMKKGGVPDELMPPTQRDVVH